MRRRCCGLEKIAKSTEINGRFFFRSRYIEQRKKKGENDDFSRKWGDRGSLEPKGIEAKSVNQW